ncbi:MAG: methylated-DNA--[protein]-cysteine S-methyltransferase [Dehalococcoidia bacterium]
MANYDVMDSPVGPLFIGVTAGSLARIDFMRSEDDAAAHVERFEAETGGGAAPGGSACAEVVRQLRAYFAGERFAFDLPLAPRGTEWQRGVWLALRAVPWGEAVSYGTIAARLGRPTASRAVGAANGRNPIPIVVPCHRVIGADRSLTGYAGGLHRKQWLLAHEGIRLPLDGRDAEASPAGGTPPTERESRAAPLDEPGAPRTHRA